MQDVVLRFVTFQVVTVHPGIYGGLAAVWFLLLVSAFGSLRGLDISSGARTLWMLLILLLPVLGLGLYACRCLVCGDWSFLKPVLARPKTARQIGPR